MAVLNKIRQRSIFLIIIIALALFSFIIGDIYQNLGYKAIDVPFRSIDERVGFIAETIEKIIHNS